MFISQRIFFGLNFRTSNKLLVVNNIEQMAIGFCVIHPSLKASIIYISFFKVIINDKMQEFYLKITLNLKTMLVCEFE